MQDGGDMDFSMDGEWNGDVDAQQTAENNAQVKKSQNDFL